MAQVGSEVENRPPPGQPADVEEPGEIEALEAVREDFILLIRKKPEEHFKVDCIIS